MAVVWTGITGIATAIQISCFIQAASALSIVGNTLIAVSGWTMVSCWRQLSLRRRTEAVADQRQPFLKRLLIQSIAGPILLMVAANALWYQGQLYFCEAVVKHDLSKALLLQEYGIGKADMYFNPSMRDDFEAAMKAGDTATVSMYLAVHADEWYVEMRRREAIRSDNSLMTGLFLHYGYSINEDYGGGSLLHQAVEYRQANQVRMLLRHGANRRLLNARGLTPYQLAKALGYKDIAALLSQSRRRDG